MAKTIALTLEEANAVGMIAKPVVWRGRQYRVHSIEGGSWYAHRSADGMIVIDTLLSGGAWITEPIATIIPADMHLGAGHAESIPLSRLKRGVTLQKSYV